MEIFIVLRRMGRKPRSKRNKYSKTKTPEESDPNGLD